MARKMKDSGTTWLDKIPEDWGLSKINSIYELRMQKVSDRDYLPLSVTMNGVVPQLDTAAKTNAHDDRKLVRKGDFVINSRSDRRGSCGVSKYDGSVSLINTVMKPRNEMNPGYYNWLFHTTQFADEFYKWGHGIVDDLWTTNWQDMKHIDIPVPSLPEQKKIADYLNKIVPEIDSLSSDIQSQIIILEDYKKSIIAEAVTKGLNPDVEMKDSGIEWIGTIPQNWNGIKLKYVVEKIGDIDHYMPETQLDGIPYVMTGDLKDLASEIDFEKCKKVSREDFLKLSNKIQTHFGDIILARYATIGTTSYVDVNKVFLVSYSCVTIKPTFFLKGKFLFYYTKTSSFIEELKKYTNSNTQGNVGIDSLYQAEIVLPSIEEQCSIIAYLDGKCAEIDGTIKEKRKQLETLEQYKKSLIYEYVTGKREVADNNG